MAFLRFGNEYLKVAIKVNRKVGKCKANEIITSGKVAITNLDNGNIEIKQASHGIYSALLRVQKQSGLISPICFEPHCSLGMINIVKVCSIILLVLAYFIVLIYLIQTYISSGSL